jgi:hypothetical protein
MIKKLLSLKKVVLLAGITTLTTTSIAQIDFLYTGSSQVYVVPAGVDELFIQAAGAKGGTGFPADHIGGNGGYTTGYLSVTPGDILHIYVGGMGANGDVNTGGLAGFNG